jgi:hypothetical protein
MSNKPAEPSPEVAPTQEKCLWCGFMLKDVSVNDKPVWADMDGGSYCPERTSRVGPLPHVPAVAPRETQTGPCKRCGGVGWIGSNRCGCIPNAPDPMEPEPAAAPTPVEPESGGIRRNKADRGGIRRPAESQGVERAQPVEPKCTCPNWDPDEDYMHADGCPMEYAEPAQPVEGPRPNPFVDTRPWPDLKDKVLVYRPDPAAPVEGVERVTDNAPARVEPQEQNSGLWYCGRCEGKLVKSTVHGHGEILVHVESGEEDCPAAQPANTDDRPAETIPGDLAYAISENRRLRTTISEQAALTGRAETRIEVLEAALRKALKWIPSTSPTYRVVCAALAAPSGVKEKV